MKSSDLFQSTEYKTLMQKHIRAMIELLLHNNQDFAVVCDVKHITFEPLLPEYITESFNETVLFIISNYTFETAHITEDTFGFEAGFGEENFGSTVTMPLLAIKQVFVGETPLLLNYASPSTPKKEIKNSMEALLRNPENQKLLKKRKS